MGRKHDLVGLNAGATPPVAPPVAPRASFGLPTLNPALKTVGVTFPPKGGDIRELDPALIDPSPITDRIDGGHEGHAELTALIRDHGQQVPILVRPHPEARDRYQIVYGRRRLRAAAELGIRVRAVVKNLSEEELVIAQGQENSARADLSFIERALFAAALEKREFSRETIMAALAIDKTTLSRLISSAVKIPRDLIDLIGPAPKTGRDRWVELATKLSEYKSMAGAYEAARREGFGSLTSDERFDRVLTGAAATAEPAPMDAHKLAAPMKVNSREGRKLATFRLDDPSGISMRMAKTTEREFGVHLAQALPDLYAAWKGGTDA